jgi:hypothetical protein
MAVPAVPAKPAIESAAPIQAVVHEFGQELGERTVQAYYTRSESGTCELMVMTQQEPGPRVRVSLAPTQTATVEDVSGGKLGLTCGLDAAQLIVNRQLGSEDAIVRR